MHFIITINIKSPDSENILSSQTIPSQYDNVTVPQSL